MSENTETENYGIDYISLADFGVVDEVAQAWNSAMPDIGKGYLFEITNVKRKNASTGTPQLLFDHKVLEGAQAGRHITAFFPLTEKAIGKILGFLAELGIKLDDMKGFSPKGAIGRRVRGDVVAKEYTKRNPQTGESTTSQGVEVKNWIKVAQ